MKSDYLRGVTVASRGDTSIVAAGVTFTTDYIDLQDTVGPVVFRAHAASNAQLSYTFELEHATARGATPSANGTGNATVARGDILGGDASGAAANGQITAAVNVDLDVALAYAGDQRYVRGKLVVANASNATQNVAVSLVGMVMPAVVPDSRIAA